MGHIKIMLANILRLLVLATLVFATLLAIWLKNSQDFSLLVCFGLGLLFAPILIAAFMAVQFLLAWTYGSPTPAAHRLSAVGVIKPWWGELCASLHVFLWLQPFFGDKKLASGKDQDKPALLLVHGYFCNRALWRGFADTFASEGHIIGSVNLEPVFGSIDEYPALIYAAIQELRGGQRRKAGG